MAGVPAVVPATVVPATNVVAPVVAARVSQIGGRLSRLRRHDGRVLEVGGEVEVVEVLGEAARRWHLERQAGNSIFTASGLLVRNFIRL